MQLEEVQQNSVRTLTTTTLPVQSASQDFAGCYETMPLYAVAVTTAQDSAELRTSSAPPTHTLDDVTGEAAAILSSSAADEEQFSLSTNTEKFQAEIKKWEEFYDQILQYLTVQRDPANKNVPKSASNFSISQDGCMYFCKTIKDGSRIYLKVIRDYSDRVRICREIHHDTGDITLHHRRDKMLELLGQMYYWKGQRRDVCRCVRNFTDVALIFVKPVHLLEPNYIPCNLQ